MRWWLPPAAVLLAALSAGCGLRANVAARVGKHKVETEAFQAYLGAVTGAGWQTVDERVANRLLDQFLDQEVVAAAARLRRPMRIPIDPGERAAQVRALLDEVCGPQPAVDPAKIEQELARRLAEPHPARAHVRQMLLDTAEEAATVRRRLAAGEDFVELSKEASRAPNAAEGGRSASSPRARCRPSWTRSSSPSGRGRPPSRSRARPASTCSRF